MAKAFAKWFYDSKIWKDCRASFIAERVLIDGGLCEWCKEDQGYIVDHVKEITLDNINDSDITLNHKNFQYLCLICHNKKTFGTPREAERYCFDSTGQLVPLPPKIKEGSEI